MAPNPIYITGTPPTDMQEVFIAYLEAQRRNLIMELRDVEKHLIQAGRLQQSALRPSRKDR